VADPSRREGVVASVFVIDDDPQFCEIVQTFLEGEGYEVRVTSAAREALGHLQDHTPDVVLLDLRMPEINGLELLPRIKELTHGAHIVVVTGLNDYRVADLLYENGADEFVTKPIRLPALSRIIARLLSQRPTSLA
jgi:DNA-binding NtrC family response regulator